MTKNNNSKTVEPKLQTFKLSELRPSPHNPRTITDEAYSGLCHSLRKFGCVEPVVVNVHGGKNRIIGGHQRVKALQAIHGQDYKCSCVTVNLSANDEALLNLTLNNPKAQGTFVESVGKYIDSLRTQLADSQDFLNLRIAELRETIKTGRGTVSLKEEKLTHIKKVHVLLSFPPDRLAQIHSHLRAIMDVAGVEYEQSAN